MAIPALVHYVFRGQFAGGEVFAWGIYSQEDVSEQAALQDYADNAAAWIKGSSTEAGTLKSMLFSGDGYTEVAAYSYAAGSTAARLVATSAAVVAGSGATARPTQLAIVVTTLTGAAGRQARGRMFLPATGASCDAEHLLASPSGQDVVDAIAAFCNTVMPNLAPVVVSRVGATARAVTQFRVDTRFDIQRGRANKLQGARYFANAT